MAEEITSLISNCETGAIVESSDTISSSQSLPSTNKRSSHPSNVICSSKFKGVVPQQNGHWGAQIYANHQRIWLGTFKSEEEAAMAYDSASIKLRSPDSHRNFPWTKVTIEEPNFQSCYTTEEVLNMIKDGSYESKFTEFLTDHSKSIQNEITSLSGTNVHDNDTWVACRQLFQKELTPSDVGKLNRIVIPKKYAVKYFPRLPESMEGNIVYADMDDVQLVFYDRLMRSWKFRYCYWKSSQSFVFTRGWNRFVKENHLKANDTIVFYLCECRDKAKGGRTFCMIDVNRGQRGNNGRRVNSSTNRNANSRSNTLQADMPEPSVDVCVDLELGMSESAAENGEEMEVEEEEELTRPSLTQNCELKGIKLFGVVIS